MIGSALEDFVQEEAFASGLELVLSPPVGAAILGGTLIVNMSEKILVRGDDYDYSFDGGTNTITILFGDDVASGNIIFQVSYAYTT